MSLSDTTCRNSKPKDKAYKLSDRLEVTIFRSGQVFGVSNFEAGDFNFRNGLATPTACFDKDVQFSLEATALNDAGSDGSQKSIFFHGIPQPTPKSKITSVTFKDDKYLVSATGLKPNQLASVVVRDDALNVLISGQQTASQSGTLDQFPVSVQCISGLRLHFVVSSDLNNSNLTSESFTTTCM